MSFSIEQNDIVRPPEVEALLRPVVLAAAGKRRGMIAVRVERQVETGPGRLLPGSTLA